MARTILESGREAVVIEGGLAAWRKQGLPVEPVPAGDVVHLPRFTPVRSAGA
ncbi:MAG: hypothetical protein U0Q16_26915 [Bryobacteraceae bacterium]